MTPAFIILLSLALTVDSQTTPSGSVRFSCGGTQCPSGQDCLQVDGTSRCMDPCDHYTPIDDAWRATDYIRRSSPFHCDSRSAWQGWYRLLLGNSSVQMPERCIRLNKCGTYVPLWLQTPHPLLSAGIIQAQVCGHYTRGCCQFIEKPIHVKACPGNYYVYKIIKPVSCPLAYCADVNTLVCNNCTAAETCVSDDKINWRCEGQETSTRHPTTPPTETSTRHLTISTTETSTRDLTTSPTASSVRFSCSSRQCPSGQDCLQVDGTSRCMDPCDHYTPLDEAWRATDVRGFSPWHCDNNNNNGRPAWQGWYRLFLGNSSVQMPERCIGKFMCGTEAPLWLQTPHPQLSAGIIQAKVCGHWSSDCCRFKEKPIHVKACPRNYYVYKFLQPRQCNLVYCADVKTQIPVCKTCSAAETCVSNGTVWRCEGQETSARHPTTPPTETSTRDLTASPTDEPSLSETELVCGQEQMRLTVPKRILEEQGLNGSSAHLIDPRCHQQMDGQKTISYLVQRREVCGSVVKNNGTHVTYSNIVFVYPSDGSESSLSVPRSFPFSCDFPLDDITSLDAAIGYQPPASGVGVVSSGDPTKVSMTLFKSPDFSEAFPSGPVRLPLGSALHVAVSMNNTEYNGFGLLLETCYVTHSINASDPRKHFLIENRCAVDRRHVQVIESGASLRARFSALLFLYHGTYEDVYLHCRISMCDRSSASCSPNCSRRQARSAASSSNQLHVAVGPISWF